jgi:hypothetical protein
MNNIAELTIFVAAVDQWCQYISVVQEPKGKAARINVGI